MDAEMLSDEGIRALVLCRSRRLQSIKYLVCFEIQKRHFSGVCHNQADHQGNGCYRKNNETFIHPTSPL
jgi:hypothetical protein